MAAKTVENGEKFPQNNFISPSLGGFLFRMYQSILSMYAMFQGFFLWLEKGVIYS